MIVIGIDPGITGAIGMVNHSGAGLNVADLPIMARGSGTGAVKNQVNPAALAELVREWIRDFDRNEVHVFIEFAQSLPAVVQTPGKGKGFKIVQGGSSIFSTGHSAGVVEGVVGALGLAHQLVPPSAWKKEMRLTSTKEQCRAFAIRLNPALQPQLKRVKDHNRAEALLIAKYGHGRVA